MFSPIPGFPSPFSHVIKISDFQPFSFHGTHKLITKTLRHTKKYIFADPTQKIGMIFLKNRYDFDSFTPDGYCHFFLSDNLREKRSVPLTV